MNKIEFIGFHVKRYRSLLDVKLDISNDMPVVICGENNIGKTNYLRALDLYFNHIYSEDLFSLKDDVPHHIYYGSRGARTKTELVGFFIDGEVRYNLKVTFGENDEVIYHKGSNRITQSEAYEILSSFRYLFVQSSNINLPELISLVLEEDGLLSLDKNRKTQSRSLEKLKEFIELSQKAINTIEVKINECFKNLTDFDGILKGKRVSIKFAEFETLRDAIKGMTSITLHDGNNHGIASKGSGAQRAVFLSLMQYISQNTKKQVIWGIDEPEAFLQPKLQKKVDEVLYDIVDECKQPVIITTHSQHFVDLSDLSNTHLFAGTQTEKKYERRQGQVFFEMDTRPIECNSNYEKSFNIKKHLGIGSNDGWEVMPYNIMVEGETDKKYIECLLEYFELPDLNIVSANSSTKISGFLQYFNHFADGLDFKPEFLIIFDNDDSGVAELNKIRPTLYPNLKISNSLLPRFDGVTRTANDQRKWEIEDFLPQRLVFEVINRLLRKEKYKSISSKQMSEKNMQAHNHKLILDYAQECAIANNPDKEHFIISNSGRKKIICTEICNEIYNREYFDITNNIQFDYIKNLIK